MTQTSETYHSTAGFAELELRLWPGALLLLEVSWWSGLSRDKLELPVGEAYE